MSIQSRLDKVFGQSDCRAIWISNTNYIDSNFLYLTGFGRGVLEDAMLIATRKGVTCFVSQLDYGTAMDQKQKGVRVIELKSRKQLERYLKDLKKEVGDGKLGINAQFLPYSRYKSFRKRYGFRKIVDSSEALDNARMIKDNYEIEKIIKANKIAKSAFSSIEEHLKEGITEKQAARKFDILMMESGADMPSFATIVAFGKNSAVPHHMPDNTKLAKNSIVLIDAGAKYSSYCSDITRTFIFKPQKSSQKYKRMSEIIKVVKDAQLTAFKCIKPEVNGKKVHFAASNYIDNYDSEKYKGRFIHALGHSIGIDVHDGDGFSPYSKLILKEGMVISNEPGIYIPGIAGARIEDDILVKKNGACVL